MITFQGSFLDGRSAEAKPVRVTATGESLLVRVEGEEHRYPLGDCKISPPLGRTSRTIGLPGGALIETMELEAVAELEKSMNSNTGMHFVSFLETRWRYALLSVAGLVLCTWAFIVFGIPKAADMLSRTVPMEISGAITDNVIKWLDENLMDPTTLEPDVREELEQAIAELSADMDPRYDYQIAFRNSSMGPNALALPSGTIVITDALVRLAVDMDEIKGVLLHEMGHIENRHGLRSMFQSAGVFLLISALAGDVTSITSAAATLPTILTQTGYSRKFEREADAFAGRHMIKLGMGTAPLISILNSMAADAPNIPGERYLSTHPLTSERMMRLEEMEHTLTKQ